MNNKRETLQRLLKGRLSIEDLRRAVKKPGGIVGIMHVGSNVVAVGDRRVSLAGFREIGDQYQTSALVRIHPPRQ